MDRKSNSVCFECDIGKTVFGSEYEVVGLFRQDSPPSLPKMFTFPNLGEFYASWGQHLRKQDVEIRTGHELVQVLSRCSSGVVVQSRPTGEEGDAITETYDELVL